MAEIHGEQLKHLPLASEEHVADPSRAYRIFQLLESLSALADPKPLRLMHHIHSVANNMGGISWYHVIWACLVACWKVAPWALLANLLLQLIVSFSNILSPKFFQVLIDAFSNGPPSQKDFVIMAVMYGLARFSSKVLPRLAVFAASGPAKLLEDSFGVAALHKALNLPLSWHEKVGAAQVVAVVEGTQHVWSVINLVVDDHFSAFVVFLSTLAMALSVLPELWWVLLSTVPIFVAFSFFIENSEVRTLTPLISLIRSLRHCMQWQEAVAEDPIRLDLEPLPLYDVVSHVRDIKLLDAVRQETLRFARLRCQLSRLRSHSDSLYEIKVAGREFIKALSGVLLLIVSYDALSKSRISLGSLTMLLSLQDVLFSPISHIHRLIKDTKEVVRRCLPIFLLLRQVDTVQDASNATDVAPLKSSIVFQDVAFSYSHQPGSQLLRSVSLRLPRGSTTAIVGASGAGKSTLISLLVRLYDPTRGCIFWDNINLKDCTLSSLRKQIGIVPQDITLFNRTIRENISIGAADATMQDVMRAAKLARAHDFIVKLDHGYNSVVGEQGTMLSGGQRQRILLARALLAKPSLLILDEATSHLDAENEKAIFDMLADMRRERSVTMFVVAHRLSTVIRADQIFVLHNGVILACGTHSELLESCPTYKNLYKLQFAESPLE